jgi:hypothetical protein
MICTNEIIERFSFPMGGKKDRLKKHGMLARDGK